MHPLHDVFPVLPPEGGWGLEFYLRGHRVPCAQLLLSCSESPDMILLPNGCRLLLLLGFVSPVLYFSSLFRSAFPQRSTARPRPPLGCTPDLGYPQNTPFHEPSPSVSDSLPTPSSSSIIYFPQSSHRLFLAELFGSRLTSPLLAENFGSRFTSPLLAENFGSRFTARFLPNASAHGSLPRFLPNTSAHGHFSASCRTLQLTVHCPDSCRPLRLTVSTIHVPSMYPSSPP
ncbi:hypothetical protein OUZ56_026534 [Daphnia magna]|uniref:Uncharacterized protein n=1 Tax=Daphnia magna TaxID=35525 RepID=A0ABQ9ZM42_9CRUS|nr:hypothetical protein OUZ56_026534 [Daphnia magna]